MKDINPAFPKSGHGFLFERTRFNEQKEHEYNKFTYAFGTDDWGDRLDEGADNDEYMRRVFVYLLCLEFKFDGTNGPSLSSVWRDLHQRVVCPLFKKAMSEDLIDRYVSFPSKVYKLDLEKVEKIWKKV